MAPPAPATPRARSRAARYSPRMTTSADARTALRLTGADVLTVLHRIGSNAMLDLPPGVARPTLFCDYRGRLLHRAHVLHAHNGAVWLLRGDAPGAELAAFIDRFVFREDVKIADHSADGFAWTIDGIAWDVPRTEAERIALGLPRHGAEIAEAFNPYEVNLAHEVHLAKGCYTGQEALMRLVTYDSVRRLLTFFRGEGSAPATGGEIRAGDAAVGVLTSVAPEAGGWVALGVVRRDATAPLVLADGTALPAGEPFELLRPLGRP